MQHRPFGPPHALQRQVLAAQQGDMSQMRAVLSQKSSQFYRLRRALGADYGTSAAVHVRATGETWRRSSTSDDA